MRPGNAQVLLLMILIGAFAGNDVVGDEPLPGVLPASCKIIFLPGVPIEST